MYCFWQSYGSYLCSAAVVGPLLGTGVCEAWTKIAHSSSRGHTGTVFPSARTDPESAPSAKTSCGAPHCQGGPGAGALLVGGDERKQSNKQGMERRGHGNGHGGCAPVGAGHSSHGHRNPQPHAEITVVVVSRGTCHKGRVQLPQMVAGGEDGYWAMRHDQTECVGRPEAARLQS